MIEIWKDIRGRRIDPRAFLQAKRSSERSHGDGFLWGAPVATRRCSNENAKGVGGATCGRHQH
jgi:hypothetical protein